MADDVFYDHNGFRFSLEEIASLKITHPAEKHLEYNDKLSAYLAGRISDLHREDVELHSRICGKCRRMVARAQEGLRNNEHVSPRRAGLWEPFVGRSRRRGWTVAAFGIALLVSILIWSIVWHPVSPREVLVDNAKTSAPEQEKNEESDAATDPR